jgi:hypothetical protein
LRKLAMEAEAGELPEWHHAWHRIMEAARMWDQHCLGTQFKWNFFCRFCESLFGVRFSGSGAWDGWGRAAEHKALAACSGLLRGSRGPIRPRRAREFHAWVS